MGFYQSESSKGQIVNFFVRCHNDYKWFKIGKRNHSVDSRRVFEQDLIILYNAGWGKSTYKNRFSRSITNISKKMPLEHVQTRYSNILTFRTRTSKEYKRANMKVPGKSSVFPLNGIYQRKGECHSKCNAFLQELFSQLSELRNLLELSKSFKLVTKCC